MGPDPRRPSLIVHADWGTAAGKRWMARAVREEDGRFLALAPERVGPVEGLLERLAAGGDGGAVLLGLDLPIGLPLEYARRAGIESFKVALGRFGDGEWAQFYQPAVTAAEVDLRRPFYPQHPGGTSRRGLFAGLGLEWPDLLRRCDLATGRPPACALFWTLGPNQVRKAAISAWRELLTPALRGSIDLALWPFDGRLPQLLAAHRLVVAETYPAEAYRHLRLPLARRGNGRKTDRLARAACAEALVEFARDAAIRLDPALEAEVRSGFGHDRSGEDRFDALTGLFGMLDVVLGGRPSGEPGDPEVHHIEGWILGQPGG